MYRAFATFFKGDTGDTRLTHPVNDNYDNLDNCLLLQPQSSDFRKDVLVV